MQTQVQHLTVISPPYMNQQLNKDYMTTYGYKIMIQFRSAPAPPARLTNCKYKNQMVNRITTAVV